MLEKLLLASILTFSFSLFTDMGWSNTKKEMAQAPLSHHAVFTLTQLYKNTEQKYRDGFKSVTETNTVVN